MATSGRGDAGCDVLVGSADCIDDREGKFPSATTFEGGSRLFPRGLAAKASVGGALSCPPKVLVETD